VHSRLSWPRLALASALCLVVVAAGIAYLVRSGRPVTARAQSAASTATPSASAAAGTSGTAGASGAASASGTAGASGTASASGAPGAWRRLWSADFRGPAGAGLDPAQWTYQTGTGTFGDGSVTTMTTSPGNVHLTGGGELDITALRQGTAWTSGRIRSVATFTPPPGGELKVTASLRQPAPVSALGYWPAFWLMGVGSWPEHGEIDIAEDVNALNGHSAAFHCGSLVGRNADGTFGPCHERTGLSSHLLPCAQCQHGFHDYSVIVDLRTPGAGQIRWYLDGRAFFEVRESQVGAATWNEAIDHGFAVMLDVALGGTYPDQACRCVTPVAATSSGGTLSVRDIAVYQRG
jgi:beta-glucanase (GH16 family)